MNKYSLKYITFSKAPC